MTSHGDQETTRWNACQILNSFLHLQEDSEQDNGHFSILDQRKWSSINEEAHKVKRTELQRRWCSHSQKADTTICAIPQQQMILTVASWIFSHGEDPVGPRIIRKLLKELKACKGRRPNISTQLQRTPRIHDGTSIRPRKNKIRIWDAMSGPSAKNSVIFSGGDSSKNYEADQQRLQISDLHFDKFPTPATFACWKIRFKIEVCICSQFPTEATQWIKEVEMVDSVDELRSSSSTRGVSMPNFEVLDAKIASALNKIVCFPNSKRESVWKNEQPRKTVSFAADRLLSWSTNTSGSLEPMILSRTIPTYSLSVYEMMIFRNWIQSGTEFYDLWRKSHLMTSWKDCTNIRVWEAQDRIGIVWAGDSSVESKTWLSQIEHNGEKKYRARDSK